MSQSGTGNTDRQRVLDATDIARLVGEHITLKPKGREFVCVCPFHDDHKPSMYVVPHKQIYHCFSCGAGGNAIDWVVNYHKLPFREALKFLADREGIELTPFRPGGEAMNQRADAGPSRETLSRVSSFACEFFGTIYTHSEHGNIARQTVATRNISDEMVEQFAIGAAPDRWDGLLETAQRKGFSQVDLAASGLIKKSEAGKVYDTFRNRLMFPIHDQLGRVIAFGGRILDPNDNPKYLNSPESALFDKSSTLYGISQASRAIQKQRTAIVVEGYTDVIACHQAGVTHVVGTLGTALTVKHASILRRLCDRVVLLFDADDAGAKAADRALEVFFQQPVDVSIAVLPQGMDPADVIAQDGGKERFLACVERSSDAMEYRFERFGKTLADLGDASKAKRIEQELEHLAGLGLHSLEPIRKRLIVQRLAELAGVDVETIQASMPGHTRHHRGASTQEASKVSQNDSTLSIAEQALGCVLAAPELIESLLDADLALLVPTQFEDGPSFHIAEAIMSASADQAIERGLEDVEARRVAIDLARRIQRVCDDDVARIGAHLRDCLRTLARESKAQGGDEKSTELGMDSPAEGANNPSHSTCEETLRRLSVLQRQHTDLGGDLRTLPKPSVTAHRVQTRVGATLGDSDVVVASSPPEEQASVTEHASTHDRTQTDTSGDTNR